MQIYLVKIHTESWTFKHNIPHYCSQLRRIDSYNVSDIICTHSVLYKNLDYWESKCVHDSQENLNLYMTIGQYNGTDFKKASKILPVVPRDF